MDIPATISEATFRRLVLLGLGMNAALVPPILDAATFRRLALQNIGGANSGLVVQTVVAPASTNDFSTLPGGVLPTYGQYIALDNLNIWTIKAGDTSWFKTPR